MHPLPLQASRMLSQHIFVHIVQIPKIYIQVKHDSWCQKKQNAPNLRHRHSNRTNQVPPVR